MNTFWNNNDIEGAIQFYRSIEDAMNKEQSSFLKFPYQENLIALHITSILKFSEECMNESIKVGGLTAEKGMSINLPSQEELLNKNTLGKLVNLLKKFLNKEKNQNFFKELDEFVKKRNRVTHKMFTQYKDFQDLDYDTKKLISSGHSVLKKISILQEKLFFSKIES